MAVHIGAEISGVDLSRPLSEAEVADIRRALLRWKVVFFRDQPLPRGATGKILKRAIQEEVASRQRSKL